MKTSKLNAGDVFSIPMNDGRFAIAQVIWMPSGESSSKFRNVFSFAVLSIQNNQEIPIVNDYLVFNNYRGDFKVIFTSKEKILNGEWVLLKRDELSNVHDNLRFFNNAGDLYFLDEHVRKLTVSEYKDYNIMAVVGYELVQQYLSQY
ncbi:hypothetical protein RJ492_005539 [Pluralibacter gergoviae]|uniref:Immunity protein 26 n=1 Tax=Pluralibacter gergoviae TaxID=61647 RepID=A0AAI9DR99_PLUGE|nr:Imm26 family immunity protein [Pluralibacter gergoviae]EKV0918326.1 hypothetical protein [Pluralibacter gergoviae]EKV9911335.1 hypothetical protein [Pluralibacter gergoviae]EKW7277357.1 hypothetical protein [Pluralibacter gergoviae]ELD4298657.1 hypothetical protein [Pluralibacter gergoviae]ELD4309429.1 hypothetical protein [Pluralibacter gergoviae]